MPGRTQPRGKEWANQDTVRHTKQDAISEREFERLVEATYRMDDDYYALECRLVLYCTGRLGMRAGELAHMQRDWIDRENERIQIPTHEACTDGRGGGICGHCRGAAEQMARIRTRQNYAENYPPDTTTYPGDSMGFVSPERFYGQMWSPKTENASREIPYAEASTRAAIAVEEYFDRFDSFQASRGVVNRRVDRMAEASRGGVGADELYPHALRGTAASYYAARGLSAMDLKALFGWAQFSTAIAYIEESPERLEDSLQQIRH